MDEEEAAALTVDDDHLQAVSLSFVRGLSALPHFNPSPDRPTNPVSLAVR